MVLAVADRDRPPAVWVVAVVNGLRRMRFRHSLLSIILMLGLLGCGGDRPLAPSPGDSATSDPPQETIAPTSASPPPLMSPPISDPAPRIDGDRLFQTVEALAVPRFEESDRRQARDYLRGELESAGWSVRNHEFDGGVNLVAERPGTQPNGTTLLLGAHYDTVPNSPGADDNASAVATVLEAAWLLRDPTPQALRLVLFDLEEIGLQGSLAYVSPETLDNLAGAIILEMMGYACDEVGCQTYPPGLPDSLPERGDFLGVVGNLPYRHLTDAFERVSDSDVPEIVTLTVPVGPILDLLRSDHAPFWLAGAPAVMVTDTANFRNPHYHRPSDTPETLDRSFLEGSAQAVVDVLYDLLTRQGVEAESS
ncbi:M28 family peptidase [Phormidium yuhuli AB48]|uniref:M28 family peptidase n=1 Tax=Phormidium yuhuli AB48 TaxID=2940671 RepID=A0ABY5AW07_9CYAN|nr:M28 family peptidase [Phormidium yuhuli]USR92946.1 M28 family peptidase [Phormidium yuhuli AB48]